MENGIFGSDGIRHHVTVDQLSLVALGVAVFVGVMIGTIAGVAIASKFK
ncbi:hypothetical protein [Phaeocystidibacter luteus]|nr:hypothetical protein [Phaeocystidibacter luteus]